MKQNNNSHRFKVKILNIKSQIIPLINLQMMKAIILKDLHLIAIKLHCLELYFLKVATIYLEQIINKKNLISPTFQLILLTILPLN